MTDKQVTITGKTVEDSLKKVDFALENLTAALRNVAELTGFLFNQAVALEKKNKESTPLEPTSTSLEEKGNTTQE